MVVVTSDVTIAVVAVVLISRAFWKSLLVFRIFVVRRIGIGLQHFFDFSQSYPSYHLNYYLTEILLVYGHLYEEGAALLVKFWISIVF